MCEIIESISSLCKKQRLVLQIKERKQKNESKRTTQQHNNKTTKQQNNKTKKQFLFFAYFRSFVLFHSICAKM